MPSQLYSWWGDLYGATTRLCFSESVRKFAGWRNYSTVVFENLLWALCISDLGVWPLSRTERPLCVSTDTGWEENFASFVYEWYCDHIRWYKGNWQPEEALAEALSDQELGSLKYFLGIEWLGPQRAFFYHRRNIYSTCFWWLRCFGARVLILLGHHTTERFLKMLEGTRDWWTS